MEEPEEFPYVAHRSFPFPCVSRPVSVHGRDDDLRDLLR